MGGPASGMLWYCNYDKLIGLHSVHNYTHLNFKKLTVATHERYSCRCFDYANLFFLINWRDDDRLLWFCSFINPVIIYLRLSVCPLSYTANFYTQIVNVYIAAKIYVCMYVWAKIHR